MKLFLLFILPAVIFAACVSTAPPAESVVLTKGVLTVTGIPQEYIGGGIHAGGSGENGGYFDSGTQTPQKITGTRMELKIHTETGAGQTAFTGSGEYLVSVELRAAKNTDTALRYFHRRFADGRAVIDWNTGSVKPPLPR